MRPLTDRKGRAKLGTASRQAARPARVLPKVQPGSARRKSARKGLLSRLIPSRRTIAMTFAAALLTLLLGLAVTGVLGRVFQGARTTADAVSGDAGFSIRSIHINGARRTPAATIAAALDLHEHESIFAADLTAARARLLALDWVASADVVRRYPDAITVTLVEKLPFALWQAPLDASGIARIVVVERNGGAITGKDIESFSRLPKLVGAGAPAAAAELVDLVQSHRAVSARIAAYEYVSQRRWNLILNDGVVVKLPEQDWQKEIDALEHLIIDKGILERSIGEIDLRSPTHFFFILRGGEHKEEPRGKET